MSYVVIRYVEGGFLSIRRHQHFFSTLIENGVDCTCAVTCRTIMLQRYFECFQVNGNILTLYLNLYYNCFNTLIKQLFALNMCMFERISKNSSNIIIGHRVAALCSKVFNELHLQQKK